MKPYAVTQLPLGYFKSSLHYYRVYFLSSLVTISLFFISFMSIARTINTQQHPLNAATSPLTGIESMRANLYLLNDNSTTVLADGVYIEYNNLYHDSVTLEDGYKFTNIRENLGLTRYGSVLAVERRPIISLTDTLFLKLWKTTERNYQFEFVALNLNHPDMKAFLEDGYLHTRIALSLSATTKVNFSINADSASASASRFKIIYQTNLAATPLPVTFTGLSGYFLSNKITLAWKVENEISIEKYEIERSVNGTDFVSVHATGVSKQNGYNTYGWIDDKPFNGNNFYRISSIDRDGSKKISPTVRISTSKATNGAIKIYPNPIRDNIVNLQFTNQIVGIYQVSLSNTDGRIIYYGKIPVNSSNTSQSIFTGKRLATGIYQLKITAPDNSVNVQQAIVTK